MNTARVEQVLTATKTDQPTVSFSGSDSAVDIAHELRQVHATDPIVPIYRAVLGGDPPPVHEMLSDDGFDAHMAATTARAVLGVYEPVQERFRRRCRCDMPDVLKRHGRLGRVACC